MNLMGKIKVIQQYIKEYTLCKMIAEDAFVLHALDSNWTSTHKIGKDDVISNDMFF